ncbi:MAG: UDP-N-acetylmuramoyl-L-alanyl-D-glutamate--2,6-diaminopimelate ligase [Candidatus Pacebacteria bacterium]|nr:UDP-N-acetylmuramoyl-L-alanyl-D-glutamate--2,6-diaminopimelate ligase [Candidatus Paceibacterota bacterium]
MIKESPIDKILYQIKKFIPKSVFEFFQPAYHRLLAWGGALRYGFPSNDMKLIGVTGTKGKSTTVYMIAKILEASGAKVAAIGSLGFKIKDREWPNTLKQTMPGRFRLQRFLSEAKKAGCDYVVLEVTSEGIKQYRHLGIKFDTAVFVNIHREHLENHGSFENYIKAKQELFRAAKNVHVLNADEVHISDFDKFPAEKKITFGVNHGDVRATDILATESESEFKVGGQEVHMKVGGVFNILNALAAWSVASVYDTDPVVIAKALSEINTIPGRLEFVQKKPFAVVVDYAHTPDSLEIIYKTLKPANGRLIVVLGAAGGGRDKWKRAEFGTIADVLADEIILTDEDPYEEDPEKIIVDIQQGIKRIDHVEVIMDRKEAIGRAISIAKEGDVVAITGKGSEISMAVSGNNKIPWSDREIAKGFLTN